MYDKIIKFKIKGLPKDKDYAAMPFGRQIEYNQAIAEFKASAKKTHLSQKRQSYQKAIREAIQLHEAKEYYCAFFCSSQYKDDSFEFWYKS